MTAVVDWGALKIVRVSQPWTSLTSLESKAYPNMTATPIQTLLRCIHPWPASRATWPPPTTAPIFGALPLGRLRRAVVSGEHLAAALGSGISWPVLVSIRFSRIQFQLSWSSSGHSVRNFTPPSPAFTLLMPLAVGVTPGVDVT